MWLTSLLRSLQLGSRRTRRARGQQPELRQRLRFLPRLEALEGRTVPSTFMVKNLADSGPGSLRQAVPPDAGTPTPGWQRPGSRPRSSPFVRGVSVGHGNDLS